MSSWGRVTAATDRTSSTARTIRNVFERTFSTRPRFHTRRVGLVAHQAHVRERLPPRAVGRLQVEPELPTTRGGAEQGDLALQHEATAVDHGDVLAELLDQVQL